MGRLTETILGQRAYGENKLAPMVDTAQLEAGQLGLQPMFEGYVSNAAYVKRNLIAILVESPRGFEDLPEPAKWHATLKQLIETQSKSIEGLSNTLTVDFSDSNPVGGAGELQEDVTNVTRSRSVPVHVWTEKYGKPINAFFTGWITGLLMDPNTKVPGVAGNGQANRPTDLLPDYTGMTVLYLEPDPTNTKVMTSWLCTNMHPKTAGDVTGRRDLTAAGEPVDYSIEFTSLTQVGLGVDLFAQSVLDELNLSGINPNLRPAFVDQISADVKAAQNGYTEQLEETASTMVSS